MSSGVWYRTLVYLGLKEEPEVGYDELPERRPDAPEPRADDATARPAETARFDPVDDPDVRAAERERSANVRQLRVAAPPPSEVRLAVVEISGFDDVEQVGARYRRTQPVLFDVSGADREAARRVIDFVAGLTYALRGQMHRVGSRAFLLIPDGVELPDREAERLRTLGYRLPAEGRT